MTARRRPAAHPFYQQPAADQHDRPADVPAGRHCAWCGRPGGNAHAVEAGDRMRTYWLHRPCVPRFRGWLAGDGR